MLRLLKEQRNGEEKSEEDFIGVMLEAVGRAFENNRLLNYFHADSPSKRAWQFICLGFPEMYVRRLDDLIYSDWYTACFVAEPNHAAMWGNYGDSHKGVCLKFRTVNDARGAPSLLLRRIVGWSGGPAGSSPLMGEVSHPFLEVKYQRKFVEIDFFRSIGRMTVRALQKDWYSDEGGSVSSCASEIFWDETEWRKKYWDSFQSAITTKLEDWRHENEYRLLLYSALGGFEKIEDRKLTYNFSDLAGITFGINTPLDDRVGIMKVVSEKCLAAGRTEFEFGQAYYSARSGRIETHVFNPLQAG